MSRSWRAAVPALLVLTALVVAPTASAATLVSNTREIVREDVTWTLPAGQCPDLPPGVAVTGNGTRFRQVLTKTYSDGSSQVVDNDVVQGTAVGTNGQVYQFVYRNKATLNYPVNAGDPVHIQMIDSFVMTATGGVKSLVVEFHWRWTFIPPAGPFDVLPPANFRQDYTKGEPLLCDPI